MKATLRVFLINVFVIVLLYGILEIAVSTYAYLTGGQTVWVAEEAGNTVQFDPVMGYKLTQTPSRFTRINDGVMNYVGTFEGNAQGFPDRDDFSAERTAPNQRVFAVLGDSFTAGNFLSHNWPDRAEDLLQSQGEDVTLLNMSGDGWGLGNWASIVDGMLEQDPYELDGLIFAVWTWDLGRPFRYADYRGQKRRAAGHVSGWKLDDRPKDHAEAMEILDGTGPEQSWIVSSEEFDEVLRGKQLAQPGWSFVVFDRAKRLLKPVVHQFRRTQNGENWAENANCVGESDPDRLALFELIKNYAQARDLPILVVYIWSREGLINGAVNTDLCRRENAREFAELIGAEFMDGGEAFTDIPKDQLEQLWLPNDGHWGQGGSDVFADFMTKTLSGNWP
ncbi:hypothetical protein [Ruegeria sp.]|uniref:hypothetical protein n=1 Tax=Ruegeria sp. TaxID=1879320 RepID=UPI003C7CD7EE